MSRDWGSRSWRGGDLRAFGLPRSRGKKNENTNIRSVPGTVNNAPGQAVNGAVVQFKNTKTLQIRSFITRDNGAYYFHGLSTDVDYELRADYRGVQRGQDPEHFRFSQAGDHESEAGQEVSAAGRPGRQTGPGIREPV